jgi:hypothetical protein
MLLASCAAEPTDPLRARTDPIIGGQPTGTADPEVFALYLEDSEEFICSATLIDEQVLMTAAHCLGQRLFAGNPASGLPPVRRHVTLQWSHPLFNKFQPNDHDLGLVRLDAPPGVSPKPWQSQPIDLQGGALVRAVGYGETEAGTSGERRTATVPLVAATSRLFYFGSPGQATCFGDSGGPLFATSDAGVETVVGVHSFSFTSACEGGGDTRVDAYASLITYWLATYGHPSCLRDNACVPGCLPVDLDCVCSADGRCSADCPDVLEDPDCPVGCAPNGQCTRVGCPRPDSDCLAAGESCATATQCASGRATTDPQNGLYCSMSCGADADCAGVTNFTCDVDVCRYQQTPELPLGSTCVPSDRCVPGARCHSDTSTAGRCAKPCTTGADCTGADECLFGVSSWAACSPVAPKAITLERASVEGPAAPERRCSVSPAGVMLLLGLWVAQRRPARAPLPR